MKTHTSRVVSLLTAVSVVLGSALVGVSPAAANDADFTFELEEGGAVITGCALTACPSPLVIPETLGAQPVIAIDDAAFLNKEVTQVVFPTNSQITSIGVSAFAHDEGDPNTLGTVSLPPSVQSIGQEAFEFAGVIGLGFGVNSQLQTIGPGAFHGNQIETVTIPNKVTLIDQGAFYANDLEELEFQPGSVLENISDQAFMENSLDQVSIPDSVTTIGNQAFLQNSLESVNFTSSSALTTLGRSAFQQNALTSFVVPVNVATVGDSAFMNNLGMDNVRFLGNMPEFLDGTDPFTNTGSQPIFFSNERTGWTDGDEMSGRRLTGVPVPIINSQPASVTVTPDESATLTVLAMGTVLGQGELSYQWLRGGVAVAGATTSSLTTSQVGSYQVLVSSWVGTTPSAVATVANPAPPAPPTPVPPAPAPVVKKKQSVKVKLPSRLKRNRAYRLPAKTRQGVALSYRVKGPGKCKINKKKRTITCKRTTAKKKFTLVGAARATSTLYAYKVTVKRRVR